MATVDYRYCYDCLACFDREVQMKHIAFHYTKRQHEVMTFVGKYISQNGYSPTLKELAEHLKITEPTVHETISGLCKKKALRRVMKNYSRNLQLLDDSFLEEGTPQQALLIQKLKYMIELWKKEYEGLLPQFPIAVREMEVRKTEKNIDKKVHEAFLEGGE